MNTRIIVEQYKKKDSLVQQIRDTKQIKLVGESMLPSLDPTKLSVLFVTNSTDFRVGDVVVFEYKYSLVGVSVHRIIKIKGDNITTKGDNNIQSDEDINMCDIIGKIESALTNNSSFVSVDAFKFIAKLSRIESYIAKRLPKRFMLPIHQELIKLYIIFLQKQRRQ